MSRAQDQLTLGIVDLAHCSIGILLGQVIDEDLRE